MLRIAKSAFRLLAFSVPFAKPSLAVDALKATPTDLLYLVVVAALAVAVVTGETRLRWSKSFLVLAAYLASMLASVLVAGVVTGTVPKLASQIYLLSIPVLGLALVDDHADLRRLFRAWLAGTAVCAAVGVTTLILFAVGMDHTMMDFALHGFGTLPPGYYPRLESTFTHPAMLCNYLTTSLAVLLICLHLEWIGRAAGYSLLGAILATAAFTLTPGLGGIGALLGAWLFVKFRIRAHLLSIACLAMGGVLAVGFVAISVVTPLMHPTAPFLLYLPGIETPLAPSVRLMAWMQAGKVFLDHPIFGAGIGAQPIAVDYVAPSGEQHMLTDAHNIYLNVAMHSGLFGLAAILLLVSFVTRQLCRLRLTDASLVPLGLGFAWLNAFAYQGLTGSYEDARHLWLLFGLLIATFRLERIRPEDRRA